MKVSIDCICPMCGHKTVIKVEEQKYLDWASRKMSIQEAFPELTLDQREALITGFCSECWGSMFPPEDEPEE